MLVCTKLAELFLAAPAKVLDHKLARRLDIRIV
jgi:hypothetical protein